MLDTPAPPRYLTKSRFRMAMACPTKLYYSGRTDCADTSTGNAFLAALAEGGYQVGALACAQFPGGVSVTAIDHEAALQHTRELLTRDEVIIYEAAFAVQGLFVRVDILRKVGSRVELIEVKAKSYHPLDDGNFCDNSGALASGWLPYLQDIAFQCHVVALAFPTADVQPSLMLADKSATASVDGLNQRFRVRRDGRGLRIDTAPGTDGAALGRALLVRVPVGDAVARIRGGMLPLAGEAVPFADALQRLARAYRENARWSPVPSTACGTCQFKSRTPPHEGDLRSGFHECWSEALGWTADDFQGGTVLDVWNLRKKKELLAQGVFKPSQLPLEDLNHDGQHPGVAGMGIPHRQWFQAHGGWPGGGPFFFDADGMAEAVRAWRYPLHFIDFETCTVAIPFSRGQRPYETIAFQFSHHVMEEGGQVAHRSQFLEATPGVDPTLAFLRALHAALSGDAGTVFRWATHENTVLNQLRQRVLDMPEPPPDADALLAFVESITTRKGPHGDITGPRNMVDLCKLAERFFFHPDTRGSSSLKKVLPALMTCSPRLRDLYGTARYGTDEMPSLNLAQPMAWWVVQDGTVRDPYDLLPAVFNDLDVWAVDADPDVAHLQDGGAAMTAYARLQFEDLPIAQRDAMHAALLRYCELDTLAMVMAVQAWLHWTHQRKTRRCGMA